MSKKQDLIAQRNEAKIRIAELRGDLSHWRERKAELDKSLISAEAAILTLAGSRWGSIGSIEALAQNLGELDLEIADEDLTPVIWASGEVSSEYVVDKVTAKRIYIRKKGGAANSILDLEGYTIGSRRTCQLNAKETLKAYYANGSDHSKTSPEGDTQTTSYPNGTSEG